MDEVSNLKVQVGNVLATLPKLHPSFAFCVEDRDNESA